MRVRWLLFIIVTLGCGLWAFATGRDMADIRADQLNEVVISLTDANLRLQDEIAGLRGYARQTNQRLAAPDRFAPAGNGTNPTTEEIDRAILDLVHARIRQGIPAERIASVIGTITPFRICDVQVETVDFIVRTDPSNNNFNSASLAQNRIVAKASGTASTDRSGQAQRWFDPSLPVRVEFTHIDGTSSTVTGVLPFQHSVIAGEVEYRFLLTPGEARFISLSLETCHLP